MAEIKHSPEINNELQIDKTNIDIDLEMKKNDSIDTTLKINNKNIKSSKDLYIKSRKKLFSNFESLLYL